MKALDPFFGPLFSFFINNLGNVSIEYIFLSHSLSCSVNGMIYCQNNWAIFYSKYVM